MAKCLVATEGVLPAVVSIEESIVIPEILVELAHSRAKGGQVWVNGCYTRKNSERGAMAFKATVTKICAQRNHMTKARCMHLANCGAWHLNVDLSLIEEPSTLVCSESILAFRAKIIE